MQVGLSTRLGYDAKSTTKLYVSLAGKAMMTRNVSVNLRTAGANGVPNGAVDEKRLPHGRSPCRATSRITRV